MPSALAKLYWLQVCGLLRNGVRRLKTVRGAVTGILALAGLFMVFGQPVLLYFTSSRPPSMAPQGTVVLDALIPVAMLVYCLLSICSSLGERAIHFSASEVDFLFPAPFSRRQLLAYKVVGHASSAVFAALVVACTQLMFLRSWMAAFVGSALALLLVSGLTMSAQLVAESVSERLYTRGRRALVAGVILLVAVVLGQVASRGLQGSWEEILSQVRHSPLVVALLAPFAVYARIITAERWFPDTLGWMALGVPMIVATYAVAFWLDANYLETAVRVSQKLQERKRRILSGDVFAGEASGPVRSAPWLRLPWCGGAGPLVWRQLVQTLRLGGWGLRSVLVLSLVGIVIFLVRQQGAKLTVVPYTVIGVMAYFTFVMSFQFPLGFRNDRPRMELLKSLPLHPLAVATGQIIVLVLLLTVFQGIVFAVTGVLTPEGAPVLLTAALFALPYNWILVGVENLLFLLYPSVNLMDRSQGALNAGVALLMFLTKGLLLAGCALVAGGPAALAYFLTQSLVASAAVAWLMLLLPAAGMLLLVAWAFRRFDVSAIVSE